MKPSYINEVFDETGSVRSSYEVLLEALPGLGAGGLAGRVGQAQEKLGDLGATFPVEDKPGGSERLLPVDWMPRIIAADHWRGLSEGLLQRGRAINAWLREVYGDGQDLVPEEIVRGSVFYRPHSLPAGSVPVHVYGPDVVHLGSGEYVVLEDNVRVPSGVAYSEAIRRAGMEAMPELYAAYRIAGTFSYYDRLRETLQAAAPDGVDEPNVAVVTRGGQDPAFFEHRRIAEACGLLLLTLGDCYVRNAEVRTREDGRKLDVIYRRFDEDYVDTDLPDLYRAYLEGNVGFANAFGAGVADDKAVFPYVPAMIEHYLRETPILGNAPTYSLVGEETRVGVLDRLPELVIKPREGYGAQGLLLGPEATPEAIEDARRSIQKQPTQFVAQEALDFSTHLLNRETGSGGVGRTPEEAFIDLRAFVLPALDWLVPGGLTRVARPGTRVVNSTAGGSSKDTWVLEE